MGVKGFYTYCKPYRKKIDLFKIPPRRIGVDMLSLLYRWKHSLDTGLSMLKCLSEYGHTLVMVIDGEAPEEKKEEVKFRREKRDEAFQKMASLQDFLQSSAAQEMSDLSRSILEKCMNGLYSQSWHVTQALRRQWIESLEAAGIHTLQASQEADSLLMRLYYDKRIDVILSSDMDYLMGGVETLWIPQATVGPWMEQIAIQDILEGEDIGKDQLIDVGILCGLDRKVRGPPISPQVATAWIRHYQTIEVIQSRPKQRLLLQKIPEEVLHEVRARFLPCPLWCTEIVPESFLQHSEFLKGLQETDGHHHRIRD